MTVTFSAPSHRTTILSIAAIERDAAGVPEGLQTGRLYAIDAVVDDKQTRLFYVQNVRGGGIVHGASVVFGRSHGVRTVLVPFIQRYLNGEGIDFPADVGLV